LSGIHGSSVVDRVGECCEQVIPDFIRNVRAVGIPGLAGFLPDELHKGLFDVLCGGEGVQKQARQRADSQKAALAIIGADGFDWTFFGRLFVIILLIHLLRC
jgi:hypothetical protein